MTTEAGKRNPGIGPCEACGQTHFAAADAYGKRVVITCDPRASHDVRKS